MHSKSKDQQPCNVPKPETSNMTAPLFRANLMMNTIEGYLEASIAIPIRRHIYIYNIIVLSTGVYV